MGIIGAGMAGLTVARTLSDLASVRVFEKSHRVGGRLATRWIDAVSFDHGAQYFTIRDERFRDTLQTPLANGVVRQWGGEAASLPMERPVARAAADRVVYVGCPSMTALPESMAIGLDISLDSTVGAIAGEPGRWFINLRDRTDGPFDWVVTTAPAPQSALMLPSLFEHHDTLGQIEMNACFTMMLKLKRDPPISFACAHVDDPVINWISRNNSKPGRSEEACLVVNSNANWADINIDLPLETVRLQMLEAIRLYVAVDPDEADAAVVHRWRYANVQRAAGQRFLLDRGSQLAACGDWCIAGRVEAAFVSAVSLGDEIRAIIEVSA